jgi:hypothetical protein
MTRLHPTIAVFSAMAASLLTFIVACASPLAFQPLGPTAAAQHARDQARGVVTRAELATVDGLTAYDAIMRLRPIYLYGRGGYYPKVYVDGLHYGEMASLRDLWAGDIEEIQYLHAADATTRFGTGHTGGAILVFTRTR